MPKCAHARTHAHATRLLPTHSLKPATTMFGRKFSMGKWSTFICELAGRHARRQAGRQADRQAAGRQTGQSYTNTNLETSWRSGMRERRVPVVCPPINQSTHATNKNHKHANTQPAWRDERRTNLTLQVSEGILAHHKHGETVLKAHAVRRLRERAIKHVTRRDTNRGQFLACEGNERRSGQETTSTNTTTSTHRHTHTDTRTHTHTHTHNPCQPARPHTHLHSKALEAKRRRLAGALVSDVWAVGQLVRSAATSRSKTHQPSTHAEGGLIVGQATTNT